MLNITVAGLVGRLGAHTANSDVKPSLLLHSVLQNASSTAEPRGPIIKSMCAISLSPPSVTTKPSPTNTLSITAIVISFFKLNGYYLDSSPDSGVKLLI